MTGEQSFTATVKIAGINPYVDVSARVAEALGLAAKVAVLVKVSAAGANKKQPSARPKGRKLARDAVRLKAIGRLAAGGWFRSRLVAARPSGLRLYLDSWMRDSAGVGVGDSVRLRLKPDPSPRELPLPVSLREALEGDAQARKGWEALKPSRRREILTYLNFLKTPAALERNVRKTIAALVEEKRQR